MVARTTPWGEAMSDIMMDRTCALELPIPFLKRQRRVASLYVVLTGPCISYSHREFAATLGRLYGVVDVSDPSCPFYKRDLILKIISYIISNDTLQVLDQGTNGAEEEDDDEEEFW